MKVLVCVFLFMLCSVTQPLKAMGGDIVFFSFFCVPSCRPKGYKAGFLLIHVADNWSHNRPFRNKAPTPLRCTHTHTGTRHSFTHSHTLILLGVLCCSLIHSLTISPLTCWSAHLFIHLLILVLLTSSLRVFSRAHSITHFIGQSLNCSLIRSDHLITHFAAHSLNRLSATPSNFSICAIGVTHVHHFQHNSEDCYQRQIC